MVRFRACACIRARVQHTKTQNTIAKVVLIFFCFTENALDDSLVTHATPPTRHRIATEPARMVRTRAPRPRASIPSRFPRVETTPSRSTAHSARAHPNVSADWQSTCLRATPARAQFAPVTPRPVAARAPPRDISREHTHRTRKRARDHASARARDVVRALTLGVPTKMFRE